MRLQVPGTRRSLLLQWTPSMRFSIATWCWSQEPLLASKFIFEGSFCRARAALSFCSPAVVWFNEKACIPYISFAAAAAMRAISACNASCFYGCVLTAVCINYWTNDFWRLCGLNHEFWRFTGFRALKVIVFFEYFTSTMVDIHTAWLMIGIKEFYWRNLILPFSKQMWVSYLQLSQKFFFGNIRGTLHFLCSWIECLTLTVKKKLPKMVFCGRDYVFVNCIS